MKNVRIFFTLSSALIVAASVYGVSADAQKSDLDQCTAGGLSKAECACETALQKGTQKALRDFLKLYRNADTACNALASTAILTDNSSGGEIGSSSSSSNGGTPSSSSSSSNGGTPSSSGGSGGLNNGHGNGDQDAPGNSGDNNNAENSEHSGQGNSGNNGGNGNNH